MCFDLFVHCAWTLHADEYIPGLFQRTSLVLLLLALSQIVQHWSGTVMPVPSLLLCENSTGCFGLDFSHTFTPNQILQFSHIYFKLWMRVKCLHCWAPDMYCTHLPSEPSTTHQNSVRKSKLNATDTSVKLKMRMKKKIWRLFLKK